MENAGESGFNLRKTGEKLHMIALRIQNYCDESDAEAVNKSMAKEELERWEFNLHNREAALAELECTLQNCEIEIKNTTAKFRERELDLEKRGTEIHKLEATNNHAFEQRELDLKQRESDMRKLEVTLEQRESDFKKREVEMRKLEVIVEQRETNLGELEATRNLKAQRKETQLRNLQAKVDEKEKLLNAGRDQLNRDIKKEYAKLQAGQIELKQRMEEVRQQLLGKLLHELKDFNLEGSTADPNGVSSLNIRIREDATATDCFKFLSK